MYIIKIEGWFNVGYLEESLEVPWNDLNTVEADWVLEKCRLGVDTLFSSIGVPIAKEGDSGTYQQMIATKYLRVSYEGLNYLVYGWVDDVVLASEGYVIVHWHIDYWRTYVRFCNISGWINRRPATTNDPYQYSTSMSCHATLERQQLEGQRRGVAWVILTFLPGDGFFSEAAKAGLSLIPGGAFLQKLATKAVDGIKGLANTFMNYSIEPIPVRPSKEFGIDWKTDVSVDYVVCCTFPVCVNLTQFMWVRSGVDTNNTYRAPSMYELLTGRVSAILGIESGRLISCYLSPLCPLELDSGAGYNGLTEKSPLVVRRGNNNFKIEYKSDLIKINEFKAADGVGWVQISNFGVRNVGLIEEGCPSLGSILKRYYHGYYKIPEIRYIKDGVEYVVRVEVPTIKGVDAQKQHTYWLMPLRLWLDAAYGDWESMITYISPEGVTFKIKGSDRYFSRVFYVTRTDDKPLYLPYWDKVESQEGKVKVYTWKYIIEDGVQFIDVSQWSDGKETTNFRFGGINHMFNRPVIMKVEEDEDEGDKLIPVFNSPLNGLFVAVAVVNDPKESPPLNIKNCLVSSLEVANEDGSGLYKLSKMNSISADWIGRAYIQSGGMTWPILRGSFTTEYIADDTHDLFLIGPSGNVVFRFPTGSHVKNYTYQTVVSGGSAYIKVKFESMYSHPSLSDCEAVIPLTPCIATTTYTNEWAGTAEAARMWQQQRVEDMKIEEQRSIENATIELNRKKYDDRPINQLKESVIPIVNQTASGGLNVLNGLMSGQPSESVPAVHNPGTLSVKDQSLASRAMNWVGNRTGEIVASIPGVQTLIDTTSQAMSTVKSVANTIGAYAAVTVANLANTDLLIDVKKYRKSEDALLNRARANEDIYRNKMRDLGGYNIQPPATVMFTSNDISWFHEYGSIELVCVSKDDESAKKYQRVVERLGVQVNEYETNIEAKLCKGGPFLVSNAVVLSNQAPRTAIYDIRARLNGGVLIQPNL